MISEVAYLVIVSYNIILLYIRIVYVLVNLCSDFQEVRPAMFGLGFSKVAPKWLVRFTMATGLIHLITKYFTYARRSTRQVLQEITNNEKLQLLFSYSFGDYGEYCIYRKDSCTFSLQILISKLGVRRSFQGQTVTSHQPFHPGRCV